MAHQWHFFRAGGVDQVSLKSGADLLALPELDQKLWVALAMPTRDVAIDPATMDLLDGDKDGRVGFRTSWTRSSSSARPGRTPTTC
jgi:hypothetical protein